MRNPPVPFSFQRAAFIWFSTGTVEEEVYERGMLLISWTNYQIAVIILQTSIVFSGRLCLSFGIMQDWM